MIARLKSTQNHASCALLVDKHFYPLLCCTVLLCALCCCVQRYSKQTI
jgi:hypothetical protein